MIKIKSAEDIEKMKISGRIVALVFKAVEDYIRPGISTAALDKIAEDVIRSHGAEPSFLGVPGIVPYPAASCISIDDEIVHGIPRPDRILKEGQIVSLDVGAKKNGLHADAARSWPVGEVNSKYLDLIRITEESFWAGFEMAKAGNRLGDISAAVQAVAEKHGYGIVRDLCGHGVGYELHEEPSLPNYGRKGYGLRLEAGMTLALEPMLTTGSYRIRQMNDGWTIKTMDGSFAAHYENSFAITKDEPLVFTVLADEDSL